MLLLRNANHHLRLQNVIGGHQRPQIIDPVQIPKQLKHCETTKM